MNRNVTIIGAGLIGLVLAKELASKGIGVTVYDRKKRVGEGAQKASGVISANGIESIGMGYREAIVNKLDGATIHAGKRTLKIKSDSVKAYVFDRERLSETFYKQAIGEGAEIILDTRIEREKIREMSNTIIVGADGAVSTVASAFGFPRIEEYVLTYKREYSCATVEDDGAVDLYFNSATARFFGWTIPYSNKVIEAGIGISNKRRENSRAAFESFAAAKPDKGLEKPQGKGYASLIPLKTRRTTTIGNVLLVGDAAGQVKSSTGGGIVFGALCAKVAAEAIENHIKRGTKLAVYESMWRKRYGPELTMHRMIHSYYSALGEKGMERFLWIASAIGLGGFLGRYGDMDRPSLMLKRLFIR